MEKMDYIKPPTTLDEQTNILLRRGLQGAKSEIYTILKAIGYYRLTGFLYHFKQAGCEYYNDATSIVDIWKLYTFDRKLRLLALEAMSRIEVWLRAQLAHWSTTLHDDAFDYIKLWEEDSIKDPFRDACKLDIKHAENSLHLTHFRQKYSNAYPPTWMALEVFSFGTTCQYLQKTSHCVAGKIAAELGINRKTLLNWMQILRSTRNICAHNQRLWDANINSQLNLKELERLKNLPVSKPLIDLYAQENLRIPNGQILRTPPYVTFCLCAQILDIIRPQSTWKERVLNLLNQNQDLIQTRITMLSHNSYHMFGFSKSNYKSYPLWRL